MLSFAYYGLWLWKCLATVRALRFLGVQFYCAPFFVLYNKERNKLTSL